MFVKASVLLSLILSVYHRKGATRSAARKLLKMNRKARNEKRPTSTELYNWELYYLDNI